MASLPDGAALVKVLVDLGPACTASPATLREALRRVSQQLPPGLGTSNAAPGALGAWNEGCVARLIHFFAAAGTAPPENTVTLQAPTPAQKEKAGSLGAAFMGAFLDDPTFAAANPNFGEWNLEAVRQVLQGEMAHLDWEAVGRSFDFPEFKVRDGRHLEVLLALYRAGAAPKAEQLALETVTSAWANRAGQLSLLANILQCPPNVYAFALDTEEALDAGTVFIDGTSVASPTCANPRGWASARVLQRLLHLSDDKALQQPVREVFIVGLLSCPEIILCALVRLQLSVGRNAEGAQSEEGRAAAEARAKAGMAMKGELMRELIPMFFKPTGLHGNPHTTVRNLPGALRRLWGISQNTVAAACIEAWRSTANDSPNHRYQTIVHIIGVVRVLPSPETAITSLLSGNKDPDFSLTVAYVMADNGMLQLRPWLEERWQRAGENGNDRNMFALALITFLSKAFANAAARRTKPLASLENVGTTLQFLRGLDAEAMASRMPAPAGKVITLGESVRAITDAVVGRHPELGPMVGGPSPPPGPLQPRAEPGTRTPPSADDIEERANQYFQQIYASEESARQVVETLKAFKASGSQRENDIFACMIHNLFDEYRFFSKYPEKELRITGILFGLLIREQLVSSITLGIALRYILEALRKDPNQSPQSGKMFRFGMFALEQFKARLHEWPQYCSHIVQIPHLREGYGSLVAEIEAACEDGGTSAAGASAGAATASDAASGPSGGDVGSSGGPTVALNVPLGGEISVPLKPGRTGPALAGFGATGGAGAAFAAGGPAALDLPAPAVPHKEPAKPRKAVFGPGLGRAVNAPATSKEGGEASSKDDEESKEGNKEGKDKAAAAAANEPPPDAILDRVQFLINNLSMSNVESKSRELREALDRRYFGWLGNYLVVKRISTQPNFHGLYLSFLDNLGDYGRGLVDAILASVYVNVGKLLRSQKITTSTSERSLLKNLGSWLGQITLARNRPILQIMLDCKELLFQGYETGMLIAVTPFVAKILEGAKNSVVFRPPNPWLMGLLGVFRALYDVDDLKMNIKFEVEVLCKNLGLRLEDVPKTGYADLGRRVPPVKERNPDFNLKASSAAAAPTPSKDAAGQGLALQAAGAMLAGPAPGSGAASTGGDSAKSSAEGDDPQSTVIPNLAAYVNVNPNLPQLFHAVRGGPLAAHVTAELLGKAVPVAVDRAIREIIQPVVERSVSIACITAKNVVAKDFAMEADEAKLRKAARLMVANLAGSLALVTCREPLHASISSHLRTLLVNAMNAAVAGSGGASSAASQPPAVQLRDQETSALDQCVAICSTENLELGCMLIEKAATEKAIRDVDESLADEVNMRKTSREQKGQPYYDTSIFDAGRYPKELPDALRPKPGGLRPDQLAVYDAFQRIPRQPAPSAARPDGPGADPLGADGPPPTAGPGGQLNLTAMNAIALKLNGSVTTLLTTAGPRAPEISLAMIPPEHEIKQLIAAVPRVVAGGGGGTLSSADNDAVLGFAQGIFKQLYEVALAERLRLEALVALLEMTNRLCPQLGRDMGTWATYAPTKTDGQRKLHRAVLLLLVRSNLIQMGDLDAYLAKNANEGRDQVWLEFLILFVRTAVLENIAPPGKMPKMIGVVRGIAALEEGSTEINPAFRKAAVRLLEEIRTALTAGDPRPDGGKGPGTGSGAHLSYEESSSMSPASLRQLRGASLAIAKTSQTFASADPPNAKQLVTEVLVQWLRVQNDAAGNDKIVAQFLQRLGQQFGLGSNDDQTERFLRLSAEVVVESCAKTKGQLDYQAVDGYAKLLAAVTRYMNSGGTPEQVSQQRLALLNKVLGVLARALVTGYEKAKRGGAAWDQRPWFRLLLDLVCELNAPDPALDPIKGGIVGVFGSTFHVVQPLVVPGFSFAWLELISHRMFLSNLLLTKDQKGWGIMHQLLIDLFLFMEPHLRKVELTDAIKKYYDGSLRVILMLVHDFPAFLAAYHLSFCNVIPENCVQLRNLILSAIPKGIPLHDPISRNFKIDQLPEIARAPAILSDVTGPLAPFKAALDGYLRNQQPADFLGKLASHLRKEGKNELDAPKVNSLVLYVGMQGLARLQGGDSSAPAGAISLGRSPEMDVFEKLLDPDGEGDRYHARYVALNAIANQLRYPSSHTHYFSCVMLYLFNETGDEGAKEQITRVLLERLITQRPHPWGLLITFLELIKNAKYKFWSHPFTRCASDIEKVFENVARSCMLPGTAVAATGAGDAQQ